MCWMMCGRRERAELRRGLVIAAARQAEQKSRREQIARPGRIHQLVDRSAAGTCDHLVPVDDDAAPSRSGSPPASLASWLAAPSRRYRSPGALVEALQLALIGEHQIDRAGLDQVEELGAIAADAENSIRQGQRNLALRLVGDLLGGLAERAVLGVRRIPQIAFQIGNGATPATTSACDIVGRIEMLRPRRARCSWCARRAGVTIT